MTDMQSPVPAAGSVTIISDPLQGTNMNTNVWNNDGDRACPDDNRIPTCRREQKRC
jgi:hypothetical protein